MVGHVLSIPSAKTQSLLYTGRMSSGKQYCYFYDWVPGIVTTLTRRSRRSGSTCCRTSTLLEFHLHSKRDPAAETATWWLAPLNLPQSDRHHNNNNWVRTTNRVKRNLCAWCNKYTALVHGTHKKVGIFHNYGIKGHSWSCRGTMLFFFLSF